MEIDTTQEYFLMRLYRADPDGDKADPPRTPHAASYAYVVFPLKKNNPTSEYSHALELLLKNGLIEKAKADSGGLFLCPISGEKRLVKKSLLNKWIHEQEILYLTDTGIEWAKNRQSQLNKTKNKRRAREPKP